MKYEEIFSYINARLPLFLSLISADEIGEFGLVYRKHGATRVLPLVNVVVDIMLVSFLSRTTISQHYRNTGLQVVECLYVFPLDASSTVYAFEVQIDGLVIFA
jgi:hypothetical protein